MAVKPEKIKERLKVLFPKANLSQKRLDEISAKLAPKPADDADDAAVDIIINDANELMGFEERAKEDDRIRTLEANQKPEPVPAPDPKPAPTPDDAPEWAKALAETNKKLLEKVEALESGKITETKRQTAAQAVESSELFKALTPEQRNRWIDRIKLDSEVSFEDQVKDFETEFTDIRQTLANSSSYSGPTPTGETDAKPSDKELSYVMGKL